MQITSVLQLSSLLMLIFLLQTTAEDYSTPVYLNTSLSQAAQTTKPNCPSKCGSITVPYPFGMGVNATCSINPLFHINCDDSFNPPKAFILNNTLEVLAIFDTKISIRNQLAWACYDEQGNCTEYNEFSMDLSQTPFSISNENKLTVVGCDDIGVITKFSHHSDDLFSECTGICSKPQNLSSGSCSGIGCCQAHIPRGLQLISGTMGTMRSHIKVHDFNPCGYSFLGERDRYSFNVSDISDPLFVNKTIETVPLLIDWAIGNETCDQIRSRGEIICHGESVCVDSCTALAGYRCNCARGYQGNPYLSPGCQDINECEHSPCHPKAICINVPGSFHCSCPPEYFGDGQKYGIGCIPSPPSKKMALYAGLLSGLGLFLILVISLWSYKILKKRKAKQLKHTFFKRNGGLLLQQQISAHDSVLNKMKIFTSEELEKATDKFNESRILGQGGQGTVYKGMLSDGHIVAIKKPKRIGGAHLVEFINEIVILSQINHRNVVKLLGCCLETEVPLLVYEFILNGTLYDLIHDDSTGFPLSWDLRLTIATEIANALAYLHYATSIPIYHRDMKSNNILLDEKYRAKLSDFGISRLVAIEQTHLTTKVKGTFGYLDPEYFRTGKFTEKSDVYSFGVVLVELLTGEKPISTSVTKEDKEEERSLVMRFLMTMKENCLKTILDAQIVEQDVREEYLVVAYLAKRCLNMNAKKRPTIREVVMELESIRTRDNSYSVESKVEDLSDTETESFVLHETETASHGS